MQVSPYYPKGKKSRKMLISCCGPVGLSKRSKCGKVAEEYGERGGSWEDGERE